MFDEEDDANEDFGVADELSARAVVSEPEVQLEPLLLDSSAIVLSILDVEEEATAADGALLEEDDVLLAIMSEVASFSFRISSLTTGKKKRKESIKPPGHNSCSGGHEIESQLGKSECLGCFLHD